MLYVVLLHIYYLRVLSTGGGGGGGEASTPKHNNFPPKKLVKYKIIQGANNANTSEQVSILECTGTVYQL